MHEDNPIRALTLPQLDCIFSSTRYHGYRDFTTWGGAMSPNGPRQHPDWVGRQISLYSRNPVSGSYAIFTKRALLGGDFKDAVDEMPGSVALVGAAAGDRAGIGYSRIKNANTGVHSVALARHAESRPVEATFENVLNDTYPLGRRLYICFMKEPGKPLPLAEREFLKFVLSKEGQEIVAKDGFGPLPASLAKEELKKIQ